MAGAIPSRMSVALPYSGRPAHPRRASYAAAPAAPRSAVLLQRVDHLLEADEVRLERREVGQQQGQALVPPVGQVAQVEGRHPQLEGRGPGRGAHAAGSSSCSRACGTVMYHSTKERQRPSGANSQTKMLR